MARGDHLKVQRIGYTHHGIDCGDGTVIHYTGEVGQKKDARVARTTLRTFLDKATDFEIVRYSRSFPVEEVIARAESRIDERGYALLWNNCEHFARWCVTDRHHSEQVRDGFASSAGSAGAGAATAAGIGVVSSAGAAAGLSGAGTMSGLATIGGAVGGGAVAGVVALGAAPAAVSYAAMRHVLADDADLTQGERKARTVGRTAAAAGGVAGSVGAVTAISAAGSVAGLSGAGITSGLAAVGATVGGGMTAGVAITVAAPAVGVAAVGYGAYRAAKWLFE